MRPRDIFVVCATFFLASVCFAELEFDKDDYTFNENNSDFGLDISAGAGYALPLNLNHKPEQFDMSERYDPVMPSIIVRAGLGAYSDENELGISSFSTGLEYARHTFENDSSDMTLDCISIYRILTLHPKKHLSIVSGEISGIYIPTIDPKTDVTGTFLDYSNDAESRTEKVHWATDRELGFGINVGHTPKLDIVASVRVGTYYPRFIFWKEFARGLSSASVELLFDVAADKTDVWALHLVGDAAVTTMELFNLNFYPETVGESHQHIFTPSLTITYHF